MHIKRSKKGFTLAELNRGCHHWSTGSDIDTDFQRAAGEGKGSDRCGEYTVAVCGSAGGCHDGRQR